MRQSIWSSYLLFPLFAAAVVSTIGCVASDRNMRYNQTRSLLNELAKVVIAVHDSDPAAMKENTLHGILELAAKRGYFPQPLVDNGSYERDAWGNPFRASCSKMQESDVFVITSSGHNTTTGEERTLSMKIVFKHGNAPEITFQGFP